MRKRLHSIGEWLAAFWALYVRTPEQHDPY